MPELLAPLALQNPRVVYGLQRGKDLADARALLAQLIELLEAGRGDEVLINPKTGKPFVSP